MNFKEWRKNCSFFTPVNSGRQTERYWCMDSNWRSGRHPNSGNASYECLCSEKYCSVYKK